MAFIHGHKLKVEGFDFLAIGSQDIIVYDVDIAAGRRIFAVDHIWIANGSFADLAFAVIFTNDIDLISLPGHGNDFISPVQF